MNSLERQNQIVEITLIKRRITIQDISEIFEISEMTARRDLKELDRQGLLRRVHGGAIANLGRSFEPPLNTRAAKNQSIKVAIGLKAADLIFDGDSIALDVGTTTLEIVKGLTGKQNLTIVTSSLPIANLIVNTLALEVDVRLILTGGIIRQRELSSVGSFSHRVYEELHVDKAFLGIGGVDMKDGLTEYNIEDGENKKILINTAREKIVVADGSKFGVTTFAKIAPLDAVDKIVTDHTAPFEMLQQIRELGIEVILAG